MLNVPGVIKLYQVTKGNLNRNPSVPFVEFKPVFFWWRWKNACDAIDVKRA